MCQVCHTTEEHRGIICTVMGRAIVTHFMFRNNSPKLFWSRRILELVLGSMKYTFVTNHAVHIDGHDLFDSGSIAF
jgi:hypothetical protein